MHFRLAQPEDLELLQRWDRAPHVIAAKGDDDWNWESELSRRPNWREQWIAEMKHKPIGFIQIIDPSLEESHYWGDCSTGLRAIDLWIGEKNDLGHGWGRKMMEFGLSRCFADPSVNSVLVDPLIRNEKAYLFFEHLGFRCIEKRCFGEEVCFVYRLDRESSVQK